MSTYISNTDCFKVASSLGQIVCRPKLGCRFYEDAPLPDHKWDIPAVELGGLFGRGSPDYLGPSVRAKLATVGFRKLRSGSTCLPCQEFLVGYHESSLGGSVIVRTVLHVDGSRFVVPSFQSYTDERMTDEFWLLFPYYCILSGEGMSVRYEERSDATVEEAALVSRDWEKIAVLVGILEGMEAGELDTIKA